MHTLVCSSLTRLLLHHHRLLLHHHRLLLHHLLRLLPHHLPLLLLHHDDRRLGSVSRRRGHRRRGDLGVAAAALEHDQKKDDADDRDKFLCFDSERVCKLVGLIFQIASERAVLQSQESRVRSSSSSSWSRSRSRSRSSTRSRSSNSIIFTFAVLAAAAAVGDGVVLVVGRAADVVALKLGEHIRGVALALNESLADEQQR